MSLSLCLTCTLCHSHSVSLSLCLTCLDWVPCSVTMQGSCWVLAYILQNTLGSSSCWVLLSSSVHTAIVMCLYWAVDVSEFIVEEASKLQVNSTNPVIRNLIIPFTISRLLIHSQHSDPHKSCFTIRSRSKKTPSCTSVLYQFLAPSSEFLVPGPEFIVEELKKSGS